MNRFFSFFEKKYISVFCILLALATRIVNVLFVSYTGCDNMFLLMQSKNLLDGNGIGVTKYFTSNPYLPIYDYTPMWPPGYPLIIAPFLVLFNYNLYWATTTFDILCCIAFIFIIRKICRQIGFPTAAVNLMTLVAGCFEYTFINDSKPTDTVSLVFFLIGLSLLFKVLSSNRFSLSAIITTAFLLFLPSFFRYSYPPLSVAVLISVLGVAFIKHDNLLKKKGLWLLASNFAMLLTFFILMKLMTGTAGYAVPTARGYFSENLIHWFPIVPATFMNLPFLTSQSRIIAGLSFHTTMHWLEIINVIAVISLTIFSIRIFIKRRFYESITPFKWFLITGFSASAAIFGSLGYLSFTYEVQRTLNKTWSYVYDHRYYAFFVVYLQIAFLGWLFLYGNTLKKIFLKLTALICSFVLLIEITHNIYFNTKVALNFTKYKSSVYREIDYNYFFNLINDLENKYPEYDIWSAAPGDGFYQYASSFFNHTGIANPAGLKNKKINIKRKTILVFMLFDHEVPVYQDFLSKETILFTHRVAESNFYVIEMLP